MQLKVALLSAGLGNVMRGFEVSAATWYNELKSYQQLNAKLYTGGKYENASKVWNLPRNKIIARFLKKLHIIHDGVKLEQLTFGVGFFIHLLSFKPDIIWLQEYSLASMLLRLKNIFGFKYKIIFCDGAPIGHTAAKKFDFIIFLHQQPLEAAVKDGVDVSKCKVIPHITLWPNSNFNKQQAREKLAIDPDLFVIICVAAWNKHHKRIDYLLNETAQLSIKKSMLLLCGQPDSDTDSLKEIASQLGLNVKWCTLSQNDLSIAYLASDIFVLPSLHEGLGAVLIEAGAHYLPVICHPYDSGKYILGKNYFGLTDISVEGNLCKKIVAYKTDKNLEEEGRITYDIISNKFNKMLLVQSFVDFLIYASEK
jgi:1,2-diacylglycerol 3-alpha-glucosyltransferase